MNLPGVHGRTHRLFACVGTAALAAVLSSCVTAAPFQRGVDPPPGNGLPAPYVIVCIIHGDGDYLYHDTNGNEYDAGNEALTRVQLVALRNPLAEVFIFHQKPRKHFLFVFPLDDGDFYHYRNGRLVTHESYGRGRTHFGSETELYRRFRHDTQRDGGSVFLYFGHEIPEFGGTGYDASFPDRKFTVDEVKNGLQGFTPDASRFDLMILSTCFGGTPYTIGTLGSSARYIIASPGNLHLSYFDLQPLERLDQTPGGGGVAALATRFARHTFERLARDVQTEVGVAVYDVDRVKEYLQSVHAVYRHTLIALNRAASPAAIGHCDCADLPQYMGPAMDQGLEVFYRPARFGRSAQKHIHSGWGCRQYDQR